jgi:hypothetical protein
MAQTLEFIEFVTMLYIENLELRQFCTIAQLQALDDRLPTMLDETIIDRRAKKSE